MSGRQALVTDESPWLQICELHEIAPDTGVCALISGRQVAVFRVGEGEQVYAVSAYDPFSGANVLSRGIVGDRAGEPKVASPVYKQCFSLRTGVCLDDPSVCLSVFDARVRHGMVEVGAEVTARLHAGNEATL
jgi:nitrite reductase (NADH) small subunit